MATSSGERDTADRVAEAAESPWFTRVARAGLAGFGVVHLLLAWLALQIAWGGGGKEADETSALRTVAAQPLGEVLLAALAVGLFALALWQAASAIWGHRADQGRKRTERRAVSAGRAVAYLAVTVAASRFVVGSHTSAAQKQEQATAGALGLPGGQVIVGVAGLAVLAVGVGLLWRGLTTGFRENLDLEAMGEDTRRLTLRLGQVGYAAKAVAFGIVGVLIILAAVTYDPDKSRGLDAALKTLAAQPYGQWLLSGLALGIACHGLYCFLWARYPRE